ncbi:MAG: cytochrome b6 [Bacteroidetes bacterium]|jgi:cytochrome b6-f complex iron-sulfur subunit|nr:cytochrome b6 [Bacteroidota bacterium]
MKKTPPDINLNKKSERREFLKTAWKILGLVAATELVFLTFNLLRPGKDQKKSKTAANLKIIGNVEDFLPGSVTPDRVNKVYMVRQKDGGFLALSLICSHLGCSVLWNEEKKQFICPCHSSAFDRLGNVINSPAPRALDYYPVTIEGGKVKIDTGQKIKRKKFDKNQVTYAI